MYTQLDHEYNYFSYVKILNKLNPENYGLVKLYANSKAELVSKILAYLRDDVNTASTIYDYFINDDTYDLDINAIENEVEWTGCGFYDFAGVASGSFINILNIYKIVQHELEPRGLKLEKFSDLDELDDGLD